MPAMMTPTPEAPARPVRLGTVNYLNARPLVEGLERCAAVELLFDVPSRLLGGLLEMRTDMALAPIVDALHSPAPLAIATVGCIASDGATRSVKLFSRTPLRKIRRVLADSDSKTSAALARTILVRRFDTDATIERAIRPLEGDPLHDVEAVVLIGDKVVRRPPDRRDFPFVLDLGEAWKEWTGLPFVYAAWMCLASRTEELLIRRGMDLLDRQRRRNRARIAWIAGTRASEHGWRRLEAHGYLRETIRTELGERECEAVERFAEEAGKAGAAPKDRRITWAE